MILIKIQTGRLIMLASLSVIQLKLHKSEPLILQQFAHVQDNKS